MKTVNIYTVYDLVDGARVHFYNFKFKNCLIATTNIVKNSDKSKWVYSGYGIAFDAV